jgi:cob(I)alamin adenosyltransferase
MSNDGATKVYTRGGDKGQTALVGGRRVAKSDPRLEAYGTVDELNCVIGTLVPQVKVELSRNPNEQSAVLTLLDAIQHELFDVGSRLACEDEKLLAQLPQIQDDRIAELERAMDTYSTHLKPLKNFVLPGGTRSAGISHLARTVCRRAERATVAIGEHVEPIVVQYLNRLSDYFFVLSRHLNRLSNVEEPIWNPKKKKETP